MRVELRQKIVKLPLIHMLSWHIVNMGNHYFYSKWSRKNQTEQFWKTLIKKRKTDECFIIGNGPSLSVNDLILLKGKDCFVSNGFYKIQNQLNFQPKYYVVQDRYCMSDEVVNQIKAECILFGDYFWRTHNISVSNAFCFPTKRSIGKDVISFGNCYSQIIDAYTVTFSMIQIAVTIGYKKICLLGIDHDYPFTYDEKGNVVRNFDVRSHFYEGEQPDSFICNVEGMNRAYICAKKYADEHGLEIVNCTRGGKLEVFSRRTLEDVLHVNKG